MCFHKAMEEARLEAGAATGAAGVETASNQRRLALLLRSGCRMVRLADVARGAAEGRGNTRAAQSWGGCWW